MTYNGGDIVVVVDPKPFLDDGNHTDGLYFNDTRMSVFIGRMFRVIREDYDGTYKLAYIDESDRLEDTYDVVTRWSWNEKWLMPADEFSSDEIDCSDLPDIMSMIRG